MFFLIHTIKLHELFGLSLNRDLYFLLCWMFCWKIISPHLQICSRYYCTLCESLWIKVVNLFHYKWKNSFSTSPAFQWKPGKCGTTTFHLFALATFFMRKKEITMLECPVWCHKMFATPPARSLFWLLKSAQCPETMSQNTNIQFPHTYFDN